MAHSLAKGQIWKNSKATFEILKLGSEIEVKITKHGETNSITKKLAPEQFRGMTKIHG